MNIVKLQQQLQNVPDSALVGYVKNPDGQVPSYLALTELNRRKEMRKDYEQQAAPEKSVAESMIDEASGIQGLPQGQPPQQMAQAPQQPMPQQPQQMAEGGLAELDIPDHMFNEESYADGGIVSFGKGGGIGDYDPGYRGYPIDAPGMSERDLAYGEAMRDAGGGDVMNRIGGAFSDFAKAPGMYLGSVKDALYNMTYGNAPVWDPKKGKMVKQRDLAPAETPAKLMTTADKDAAFKAQGEAAVKTRQDYLNANPTVNPADTMKKQNEAAVNQAGVKSLINDALNAPNVSAPYLPGQDKRQLGNPNMVPPKAPPAPPGVGAAPPRDPRLQTVSEIGYELPKVDIKTIKLPEGIKTLDYINQQKQAMAEAGVDPNFFAKQAESIAADREALKGQRSDAGSMALAKAGFAIAAGKSPYALSNIAEGAGVGLDQYGRDLKEIKADEKLLRAADNKLAEAQYLQSRGDAQGALAAMKERENLIFSTEAKNIELQNQGAIEESRQKADRNKTIATEQGANTRQAMQIGAQKAINQADIQSRERIAKISAQVDLSKQQRANIDKVHDNAKAQVKLEIDGGVQYSPAEIQDRIDVLTSEGLIKMGYNIPGVTNSGLPAGVTVTKNK